ncbi:MAG TPA: HAD family hydrolase [Streptosporangiaceae bacterium]|nr:HAD family hydrolase [Streptosporangiaceae bacterium]
MTDAPRITLVCFGLVGTLVADAGVIELAFGEAVATQGVVSGTSAFARAMAQVHRARGQAPADVMAAVFPGNVARAQAALLAFERSLAGAVDRTAMMPVPGAGEVLAGLANAGIRTCVTTMLPRRQLTLTLEAVGWADRIPVALTVDDVPRGCPFPDLALAAMLRTGVDDVRELMMVHGTAAGVECGRRAGAQAAVGVLTGPHPEARLTAAGATHVISSVSGLPGVLASIGPRRAAHPAGGGQGERATRAAVAEPPGAVFPPQMPARRRNTEL